MNHKDLLLTYLQNPGKFSVLILGPRGIGKTKLVTESALTFLKLDPVIFNCASIDEDALAESRLFGYEKGAFTGADKDTEGLFHKADKAGVLFFDEVHTLSRRMQEKLMTQLQTVPEGKNRGKFRFRRVQGGKDEFARFQPVFASNKSLSVLKEVLLPDFYDRISQLSCRIPSIKEQGIDQYQAFLEVWPKFEFQHGLPTLDAFQGWVKQIDLSGNYRDLDTIAILWDHAQILSNSEEDAYEFVKHQFEEFHLLQAPIEKERAYNFRRKATFYKLMFEYRCAMQDWAISKAGYGSAKAAQEALGIVRIDQITKVKKE